MTPNLDNIEAIKKLDVAGILQKTIELPDQIEKCWSEWQHISIPSHFGTAKNVLILGMGGSGVGGGIISSLSRTNSNLFVSISRDYNIPLWVDKNTLVIAVSYSGETEETLEGFRQAAAKTEKLISISTGGKLASLASQYRALSYVFDYQSQPRAALGFSLTSLLAIFTKLRFMEINQDEIEEAAILVRGLIKRIGVEVENYRNPAKLLAQKLVGKIPVIIGSGLMGEIARRWKQHVNENAKNACFFEEIPEMNHNALVGLEFPERLGKETFFVFLQSKYNHPRNKICENATTQILTKRHIPYETVLLEPTGGIISEMYQMISFGDFVAYYLAILNNVAPDPVSIIDFLKEKLAENA